MFTILFWENRKTFPTKIISSFPFAVPVFTDSRISEIVYRSTPKLQTPSMDVT